MDQRSLFKAITFIQDDIEPKLVQYLLDGGAKQIDSLDELQRQTAVHIITSDYNSPISLTAREHAWQSRTIICSPLWVKSSIARGRIQDVRAFSPDPRQFFTGVQVVCSDLPEGDQEAIYGGVLALGGRYTEDFVKGTTHIVALSMKSDMVQEALARPESNVEIVLPHWFDDCLRLRRRVSSEPYKFPEPKIFRTNSTGNPPMARSQESHYQYLSDASLILHERPVSEEDIFGGKKFFIGHDLQLEGRILETLAAVLGAANGSLAKNLASADVYIGKYREGSQYVTSARNKKIIGNYTWILYCISKGKYSSPRNHLLHYPMPRGGLPEFKRDLITVSNYTGEARSYLERLIIALGATFTRNMKAENTVLITAHQSGEKYNAAKAWDIDCVNHLWLEESYAKWKKMAITNTHYSTFPRETNLMDVIAQTPIEEEGIELFYAEAHTEDDDDKHTAEDKSMRDDHSQPILADLDEGNNDLEEADIIDPPNLSSPLLNSRRAPVHQRTPSHTDDAASVQASSISGNRTTRKGSRKTLAEADPATPSRTVDSNESSRGSTARKASQAAASKLRDNMEDANRFAQQQRNKHKLPPLPSEAGPAPKRLKVSSVAPNEHASIRAVMTGCPMLTANLQEQCEELGIELIEDPLTATHVISPRIARTKKFVVAIPHGPHFVSWNWLLDSVKAKKIQSEGRYPPDSAPSALWSKNLSLDKLCSNAEQLRSRGGLLKGFVILISDAVTRVGGIETYRDIVEANGGTCGLQGRRGTDLAKGRVILITNGKADPAIAKLNAGTHKPGRKGKENKSVKKADAPKETVEIYDREWLMICAIRQELVFEETFRYH